MSESGHPSGNVPAASDWRQGTAEPLDVAVLIPAWRPEASLPLLVESLIARRVHRVLIVDDGSGPAFSPVFERAVQAGAEVLPHAVNRGKGCALKTGFASLLTGSATVRGVVTADADGQHTVADILGVARTLAETAAAQTPVAVLGARSFSGAVPLRSRLGNALTRHLFAAITGQHLRDTQSGLRGLPMPLLPELLALPGERYEYETAMLAHLCRTGRRPVEVPIETVYLAGNRGSHFRPLRDTVRVGRALLSARRAASGSRSS